MPINLELMPRGNDRARLALVVSAVAPALVAVGFSAVIVLTAAVGRTPSFWHGGALTLSEAAGLRDHGEVVRQIAAGADPNQRYALRPDVLSVSSLTPLEAAVAARRAEVVDLLMLHGARMDADTWRRLHCFALKTRAEDVVQTLDQYRPAIVDPSCAGVVTPF